MSDQIFYKACTVVVNLAEATNLFLNTKTQIQNKLNLFTRDELNTNLTKLVQEYEQVNMIVNVIKNIYNFLNNQHQKTSLANIANSAEDTTFNSMLNFYQSVISNQTNLNNDFKELINQKIYELLKKNEKFDLNMINLTNKQVVVQDSTESVPANQSLSTSQFLEGFETTAAIFAQSAGVSVDNVWESLFIIASPQNHLAWVQENLLHKGYSWSFAKEIYLSQYPDYFGPSTPTSKTDHNRAVIYAEKLLSLEMGQYENIEDYNKKYLRYCIVAQMDLKDKKLFKRYIKSILPKYQNLVNNAVYQYPQLMNNLSDILKISSDVINCLDSNKPSTLLAPNIHYHHTSVDNYNQHSNPFNPNNSAFPSKKIHQ